MPQEIHISLEPTTLGDHLRKLGERFVDRVILSNAERFSEPGDVLHVDFLGGVMGSGRSALALWAELGDHVAAFYLTAGHWTRVAGAIRGDMAKRGELNVSVNPPMAIAPDPGRGLVHFVFETPFQEFDYTPDEAEKLVYHLQLAIRHARR